MQNAPSTQFPVGRSSFFGAVLLALGACVFLLCCHWWWGVLPSLPNAARWQSLHMAGWLVWPLALVWALWAWRAWCCPLLGQLQWDAVSEPNSGADPALDFDGVPRPGLWRWHSRAYRDGLVLTSVVCVWDLQRVLLLRLERPDGRHHWVWLQRGHADHAWVPLRRALHAHAV